jgi:catechol 2,3-dioxygenase-like lactoylglutathione lyase family enzyme
MKSYEHLIGLPYEWGVNDCYSLVRRFYNEVCGMNLKDYVRPKDFWRENIDLYGQNFRNEGFETIDLPMHELRPGDGFLIAIGAPFPTHAAVYVGGDKILHHFTNQLSTCEPYRALWRRSTVATLRHPDALKALHIQPQEVELGDLLPPHIKEKFRVLQAEAEAAAAAGQPAAADPQGSAPVEADGAEGAVRVRPQGWQPA